MRIRVYKYSRLPNHSRTDRQIVSMKREFIRKRERKREIYGI